MCLRFIGLILYQSPSETHRLHELRTMQTLYKISMLSNFLGSPNQRPSSFRYLRLSGNHLESRSQGVKELHRSGDGGGLGYERYMVSGRVFVIAN